MSPDRASDPSLTESLSAGSDAAKYDAGAMGSRSGFAPALQYFKAGAIRLSQIKFDGVDAANKIMIDRKWNISRRAKSYLQAQNQSLALEQNGMTGVWEVPNESVARQARKMLASQNIINIRVRIVSP
ncbi:hypothetical protein ACWC5O_20895 [Streptomyces sp. NPDC001450]